MRLHIRKAVISTEARLRIVLENALQQSQLNSSRTLGIAHHAAVSGESGHQYLQVEQRILEGTLHGSDLDFTLEWRLELGLKSLRVLGIGEP